MRAVGSDQRRVGSDGDAENLKAKMPIAKGRSETYTEF